MDMICKRAEQDGMRKVKYYSAEIHIIEKFRRKNTPKIKEQFVKFLQESKYYDRVGLDKLSVYGLIEKFHNVYVWEEVEQ